MLLGDVLDLDREDRVVERRGHRRVELVDLGVGEVVLLPDARSAGRGSSSPDVAAVSSSRRTHTAGSDRVGEDQRELPRAGVRPLAERHRRQHQPAARVVLGDRARRPARSRRSRPCRSRRRPGRRAPGSWRRSGRAPARSSPSARPPPAARARRPPRPAGRARRSRSPRTSPRAGARAAWSSCVDTWVTRVLPIVLDSRSLHRLRFTPFTYLTYLHEESSCWSGGVSSWPAGPSGCCWPAWPSWWPPACTAAGVFDSLSQGGFDDPDSEASRELALERETFGNRGVDAVAIYSSDDLTADSPEFRAAVEDVVAGIPDGTTSSVVTWYDTQRPDMVSEDGTRDPGADLAGGRRARTSSCSTTGTRSSRRSRPTASRPTSPAPSRSTATSTRSRPRTSRRAEEISLPIVVLLALPDLRQPRGRRHARPRRRARRGRLARRGPADHRVHRGLDLLGQRDHPARHGPRDRLRPVHDQPVPRGAGEATRSTTRTRPRRPSSAR